LSVSSCVCYKLESDVFLVQYLLKKGLIDYDMKRLCQKQIPMMYIFPDGIKIGLKAIPAEKDEFISLE
jgi:hypothetical protein